MRFARELNGPGCYLIERRGLRAIGSHLPAPRAVNRSEYEHDVGLGWLWLAAQRGAFGGLETVTSERQMRSHDGRAERGADEPLGVRLPAASARAAGSVAITPTCCCSAAPATGSRSSLS